jgi:UDP-2,4-diacetamido-2,4,6-trideoxy-beta-L-altropyranose hydrolase
MNIVVRADASAVIGAGHVMRMLTLAEGLRNLGADVTFVGRRHKGNLLEVTRTHGFSLVDLPEPADDFRPEALPERAAWVGACWQDDAQQTLKAIGSLGSRPDWLVVDHYGLDKSWEATMRPAVQGIFVVDDLADRMHDCDFLLDQNLVEGSQRRYVGKVSPRCRLMLGPRYALLSPVYSQLRERTLVRQGKINRILISFGGSDQHGLSTLALRAFVNLNRRDIEVDVIVADTISAKRIMDDLHDKHSNIHVHVNVRSLAPFISAADLAIGAVGSTSWERLCLGLPSLVITTAENQKPLAEALHARGLVEWLGHFDEVSVAMLEDSLRALVNRGCDEVASRMCREIVDGSGLSRVLTALLLNSSTPLAVRSVCASDESLLFDWSNDPETRQNSFSSATIAAAEHHNWLAGKLRDVENCRMYIIETKSAVPVGQVRFELEDNVWFINYSVGAPYRGKGLGRRSVELALSKLRATQKRLYVAGRVAPHNLASHRVFQNLGFASTPKVNGTIEYSLTL